MTNDISSFLNRFLVMKEYTYDYKSDSLKGECGPIEFSQALSELRIFAFQNEGLHFKNYFKDILSCWKRSEALQFINSAKKKLAYRKVEGDLVTSFVEAVSDHRVELDTVVFKHWIWQVKRKIFDLEVDHHLMPVFFGRSGAGKSVALRALLSPLADFYLSIDMSILSDQFSKKQFTRNFVVFFDELDGAEDTDINRIKQIITAENMEYRVMRTEGYFYGRQNSSFIGCSNSPVRDRISDSTSARRFWQITTKDLIDWNKVNSLDYLKLWQSVDENSPAPIIPYLEKVREIQEEEIRSTTILEEWLRMCYGLAPGRSKAESRTSDLYEHFINWKNWQSISYPISFQKFARELKQETRKVFGKDIAPSHVWNGTTWPLELIENIKETGK